MDKKKRSGDDLFWFGRDFEEEFERMREEIERLMGDMMGHIPERNLERFSRLTPGVYGVSVRIGSDGKPVVREFGNVKPEKEEEALIREEREPLVDVIDGKENVIVIAEVPGVDKKDVKMRSEGWVLQIRVNAKGRKYKKDLELPTSVDMKAAKATYNNGVLEIVIPKAKGSGGGSHEINIS